MYPVKLIASVIVIIVIASVVIILIQSNKMISLPGLGNNNNDSKQNMATSPESKPSLLFSPPSISSTIHTNLQNKLSKGNNEKIVQFDNSTHVDTPYVKEFNMPNGTWPNGILVARNGIVWTVGTKSNVLISFDPKQDKIRSLYSIPEESENATATIANSSDNHNASSKSKQISLHMVWSMVEDKDGYIWFTGGGQEPLLRFQPSNGKFDVIHSVSAPMQMKVDQKTGNIWFTTFDANKIGVIQKR
jgi:hypothetical protein